jgi:hypothetical protein
MFSPLSANIFLGMSSIRLFRDLGSLSTFSLLIWAAIIWIVPVNSNNPLLLSRSHLNMAPDFLVRNLSLPELKGSLFLLSGYGFASGNLNCMHGK